MEEDTVDMYHGPIPTEEELGMTYSVWSARTRLIRSQSSGRSSSKAKSLKIDKTDPPPYVQSPLREIESCVSDADSEVAPLAEEAPVEQAVSVEDARSVKEPSVIEEPVSVQDYSIASEAVSLSIADEAVPEKEPSFVDQAACPEDSIPVGEASYFDEATFMDEASYTDEAPVEDENKSEQEPSNYGSVFEDDDSDYEDVTDDEPIYEDDQIHPDGAGNRPQCPVYGSHGPEKISLTAFLDYHVGRRRLIPIQRPQDRWAARRKEEKALIERQRRRNKARNGPDADTGENKTPPGLNFTPNIEPRPVGLDVHDYAYVNNYTVPPTPFAIDADGAPHHGSGFGHRNILSGTMYDLPTPVPEKVEGYGEDWAEWDPGFQLCTGCRCAKETEHEYEVCIWCGRGISEMNHTEVRGLNSFRILKPPKPVLEEDDEGPGEDHDDQTHTVEVICEETSQGVSER